MQSSMRQVGDLHCHSVHSDGSCTTAQIVRYALRRELTHLALTDHDTMAGVAPLTEQAGSRLQIIPGVECTCTDLAREQQVHLLCYYPRNVREMQRFLDFTLQNRRHAKMQMLEKLKKLYPIEPEDVLELCNESASIHETHLMQALAHMGYTATVSGDLLQKLIGKRGSCYVPVIYPGVLETIAAIRGCGGLVVLAHPAQFNSLPLAQELCTQGLLDGIECYHPRNDSQTITQALRLAETYKLLVTGGTDFHGMYTKNPHPLGTCTTDSTQLQRLLERRERG